MPITKANEREFQGQVIAWIKKQINLGGLSFKNVTNDSGLYGLPTVKFPDVLLTLDFECQRPFCGWELKPPRIDIRDKELLKDAVRKAQTLKAKYFVTWNMQTAIIWRTPDGTKATVNENDKVREFSLYQITDVNDVREPVKAMQLESLCMQLLRDLDRLHHDENINLPVADATVFVGLVGNVARQMAGCLLSDLNRARGDKAFDARLRAWATKQGVSKYDQDYYLTLAQQIAYKIIGKVLFYMTLRRHKLDLPRMELPAKNYKTAINRMRELFQRALEVDYQAIFEPDITDQIELSADTTKIITDLTEKLTHWTFEVMPLDVIGNVFEKLIPEEARHSLGQYFTPDNLADLIIAFCVQSGNDSVMDPTCGTGTFLIRSYNRLRNLDHKPHHQLLERIWGVDIAGFPAELATINLCRQDFNDYLNFPRVMAGDFFDVMPGDSFQFPPPKKTAKTGERVKVKIPEFDALVGNFPFIRQELIEKVERGYKKRLEEVLFESWGKEYPELFRAKVAGPRNTTHNLQLSGQADIYAYMFFHAAAHLKAGGRMGFVTSNSWLDVAYGYELQKFFLSKFKLVAICESRCEPWFEQSAVNTVFTILERSDDLKANKNNLVRFVKLKKPLKELFPENVLTDAQARWIRLEGFVSKIEGIAASGKISQGSGCRKFNSITKGQIRQPEIIACEDEDIRVRMIRQEDLQNEIELAGQTVKWGQYLRAPDIYFEILKKCADKFVPLSEVAEVRFGIKTGINEFFYLDDDEIKHWGIEKEFLKPVVKSPRESSGIELKTEDLQFHAFLCHKDKSQLRGTNALKYIKWGESQKTEEGKLWPEVESVRGRKYWYELPEKKPSQILLPMTSGANLRAIINDEQVLVDHRLFEITALDNKVKDGLGIYLNSAVAFLNNELIGRANLGDGALEIEGIDWERILVPEKESLLKLKKDAGKAFEKLCRRDIENIKAESKKKDRIEFEKTILQSLELPTELAEQILAAVVGLVEERHLLPKQRSSKKKKRVEQDFEKLKEEISNDILPDGVIKFPDGFVKGWPKIKCKETAFTTDKLKLGESFFDKQQICDAEGQYLMEVGSKEEGKFLVYAKKKDIAIVKLPESRTAVKKAVQEYEIYLRDIKRKLYTALMEQCGDLNISENMTEQIFEEFDLPDIR